MCVPNQRYNAKVDEYNRVARLRSNLLVALGRPGLALLAADGRHGRWQYSDNSDACAASSASAFSCYLRAVICTS